MSNSPEFVGRVRLGVFAVTRRPTRRRPVGGLRFANPPYELLSPRHSFSFFLLPPSSFPIRYSPSPIRHPDEGMAERRQAPGCCVAPGSARHDRRAGVVLSTPSVLKRGERPPLGAPPWRFCGPGLCSPLSGIPSAIVRRPHTTHGSSLPGGPGLAGLPRGFADPQT